jgi:Flp pilus assembly protein TadD
MRFAEASLSTALCTALLCMGVAGCSVLNSPFSPSTESAPPPAAAPAKPSSAAASAATPAAQADASPTLTLVSPGAQRAFDDAVRAMRAGRTADAERGFTALTKSNPELGGPHANLGLIYGRAGKWPEAVSQFELAVKANPQRPVYFNQLGIAYRQQGEFTKARDAYEKAVSLDGNYAAAILNLGILHDLYLADGKRALELYERYLVLTPAGDPAVTKWIADLKNRKPQATAAAASNRKEKE